MDNNHLIAWIQHTFTAFLHFLGPAAAADLIALGSLIVALSSYRNSRRATDLAQTSHDEHGRLKSVRINFVGKRIETTTDGRHWTEASPHAGSPAYLDAATVLSAYGGPDPLYIDQVVVQIEYREGVGLARSYTINISLRTSYDQLFIKGPRLPEKLDAYHRCDWRLPLVTIVPFAQHPAVAPGLLVMPPYDYMAIKLIATPTGHTPTGTIVSFDKQLGLVTRRHHFNSLNEAMSGDRMPETLKTLLSVWIRSSWKKIEPDKTPGRTKRKRRRKQ